MHVDLCRSIHQAFGKGYRVCRNGSIKLFIVTPSIYGAVELAEILHDTSDEEHLFDPASDDEPLKWNA